jgi:hypothetical protein
MALVADGAAWVAAIASLITALVTASALALAWWAVRLCCRFPETRGCVQALLVYGRRHWIPR